MHKLVVALAALWLTLPGCVNTHRPSAKRIPTHSTRHGIARIKRENLRPPPWPRVEMRADRSETYPRDWMPRRLSRRWSTIVVHHSATAEGGAKAFDKFHKETRGWDGLGYHFVIGNGTDTLDGEVEVGARWRQQKTGAHCKTPNNYYNEHGIGICLVGDFTQSRPTARQLASLRKLTRFLAKTCDIAPIRVTTHRNVTGGTVCPGPHFHLEALRNAMVEGPQRPRSSRNRPALASEKPRAPRAVGTPASVLSYQFAPFRPHRSH